MLKNSFLGRRDEPAPANNTGRATVDSPRYAPQPDAAPLSAVAVNTLAAGANAATAARINAEQKPSSSLSTATPEPTHAPGTPRLTVGPNITLKGAEINDCDTLVVEGHVEASMDSKTLEILKTGSYQGSVSIDVAEIHGRFDGNLTARKKLIVHATGCVSGTVRYGSLLVSEGGVVSGDIASIDSNGEPQLQRFAGYPSARVGAATASAAQASASTAAKPNGGAHATP